MRTKSRKIRPGFLNSRKVSRCIHSFSASASNVWIQPWSRCIVPEKDSNIKIRISTSSKPLTKWFHVTTHACDHARYASDWFQEYNASQPELLIHFPSGLVLGLVSFRVRSRCLMYIASEGIEGKSKDSNRSISHSVLPGFEFLVCYFDGMEFIFRIDLVIHHVVRNACIIRNRYKLVSNGFSWHLRFFSDFFLSATRMWGCSSDPSFLPAGLFSDGVELFNKGKLICR